MATRAPRVCSCGRVVAYGDRCQCQQARDAKARAQHDRTRPSASERGYDAAWRKLRAKFLKEHPACSVAGCTAAATEVDHVLSVKQYPKLRLEWQNLRSFCKPHHSRRTATEQGFARRG